MPLGLNGGIIGLVNSVSDTGAVGVWTLDQISINRLAGLWPTDIIPPAPSVGIQIFTESTTWTAPEGVANVEYLVVAGGGGGGTGGPGGFQGGGGGAGGYRTGTGLTVSPGTSYTITIGAGGSGGPAPSPASGANGSNSGLYAASPFPAIWSAGGGGGGEQGQPGRSGGSGGGFTNGRFGVYSRTDTFAVLTMTSNTGVIAGGTAGKSVGFPHAGVWIDRTWSDNLE